MFLLNASSFFKQSSNIQIGSVLELSVQRYLFIFENKVTMECFSISSRHMEVYLSQYFHTTKVLLCKDELNPSGQPSPLALLWPFQSST